MFVVVDYHAFWFGKPKSVRVAQTCPFSSLVRKIVRSSYELRKMILQTILGMWSCYKCRNCLGQRALQPKHTKYLALWLKRRELYKCLGVGAKLEKLTPQANRSLTKRDNAAPNNSQNNIRLSLCA